MKRAGLILLFTALISGCGSGSGDIIKAPGMVEGEVITMKSRIASNVTKISVAEGDELKAGEELVRFDPRTLDNKLKDITLNLQSIGLKLEKLSKNRKLADTNVRYLQTQREKFERLNRKNSVSGDDLEKIKLKLLEAETALFDINKSIEEVNVQKNILENNREYLGLVLEDYIMTSGVSGIVLEKFVSPGENVFPGSPVFDILDTNSLFIEIFLEEKELVTVKTGTEVGILMDGAEQMDLKGVVAEIGRKAEFSPKYVISEVERKALLYKVKIRIKDNPDMFKIGMPVTVLITRAR